MIKFKKTFDYILTYTLIIFVIVIFLLPALWLVLSSLSASGSIYSFDGFFPKDYSFDTFHKLFNDTAIYNYPRWFFNTLYIAFFSSIIGTILVVLTAYIFSRFDFKSRKRIMRMTLILGMFPAFMAMTAIYLLMTEFNFVNNRWGLILFYAGTAPMGYLVQKGFFDTIPNAVYEAAIIEGANELQIFRLITIPMAKPILVYTLLTSFTWPWSDFILPSLLIKDRNMWTVAVGLMSLGEVEFARFAAGSVFIAVPIVILYFVLSKYLISGISAGAVK